jgi:hypothetical protein
MGDMFRDTAGKIGSGRPIGSEVVRVSSITRERLSAWPYLLAVVIELEKSATALNLGLNHARRCNF